MIDRARLLNGLVVDTAKCVCLQLGESDILAARGAKTRPPRIRDASSPRGCGMRS